jgi:hypothetical protein
VSLGAGLLEPLIFVLLMLVGMLLVDKFLGVRASTDRTLRDTSGHLETGAAERR